MSITKKNYDQGQVHAGADTPGRSWHPDCEAIVASTSRLGTDLTGPAEVERQQARAPG